MIKNLRMKIERQKRGLTQLELAHAVGISEMRICRLETGRTQPSPREVQRISKILGKPVEELFGESDER